MTTWEVILQGSARADLPAWAESPWCLRCLLLVMCTYRFAKKKALTLHLACGEGRGRNMSTTLGHSRAAFSEPRLWWGDS